MAKDRSRSRKGTHRAGRVATALAAIGLYGVMDFVVARRTKELGVRLALGAQRSSLIWLVMKEVLLLLVIGLAIGVPSAMGLGHFVESQLYGVQGSDPWLAGTTIMLLAMVSAAAGMIPRTAPAASIRFWRSASSE